MSEQPVVIEVAHGTPLDPESPMGKIALQMREEGVTRRMNSMVNIADICIARFHDKEIDFAVLTRHVLYRYAEARGIVLETLKPH